MELEFKHLASYLPCKLYIYDTISKKHKLLNTGQGSSGNWVGIKTVLWYNNIYKPILIPLSDLNKENEIEGYGNIMPIDFFENTCDDDFFTDTNHKEYIEMYILTKTIDYTKIKYLPKGIVDLLIEWHFDIFGLIEKGLAIDKNTLNLNNIEVIEPIELKPNKYEK